ncbi:hypothetical protein [Muricoccus radiodurans]|uniref:hypothetical protein n=1 Tax=Muricoccus radiodurans TaxID=2231721 RepID=UPI003CFAA3EB
MSHLVHNERIKLAATFLNTIGTGLVVVGAVAPLVAVWDHPGGAGVPSLLIRTVTFAIGGAAFHLLGRLVLGGLRDDP